MFNTIGRLFSRMFGNRNSKAEQNKIIPTPIAPPKEKNASMMSFLRGSTGYKTADMINNANRELNKLRRRRAKKRMGRTSRQINRRIAA